MIRTRVPAFFRDTNLGTVLLAVLVGLAGGAAAIGFRFLIAQSHDLFFSGSQHVLPFLGAYRVIVLPALGLIVVVLLVRRWAPEARGHGVPEVQYAVRMRGGRIRPRVAAVKALASAVCIGSGGSVGREGPIVQIGSSFGSALGGLLRLHEDTVKLLLACGAAAGIGGTFNAPIAGAIFATEVILGSFTGRSFGLVVLAAVASTALVQSVLGREPAFALQEVFTLTSSMELLLYLGLGIVAGALSVLYVRTFYLLERTFARWSASVYLKAALGGLGVGLIGYIGIRFLGGAHLFGVGYEGIEMALALGQEAPGGSGETAIAVLLLLCGLKIIATSLTLAAGGSGGVFAPCLYIGAMAGGAFGLAANAVFPSATAPAGAYALVGMGAVFAGAAHAPISSILILFEMTGDYEIILPLMLAVVVSHLMAFWLNPESIYTTKLRHLGGLSPAEGVMGSVLDLVLVADAMTSDVQRARPDTSVMELATRFRDQKLRNVAVVEADDSFLGLVTTIDVQNALFAGRGEDLLIDIVGPRPVACRPDESLREVLQRISDSEVGQVPVVDKEDPSQLLGLLQREQILWAMGEMAIEHGQLLGRRRLHQSAQRESAEVRIVVRSESRDLCFKRVRDLRLPEQCLVTLVRRGEQARIPDGRTLIEPGDVLTVVTTRTHESRLRAWVARLG